MANSRGYPEITLDDDPNVPEDMNALGSAIASDVSKVGLAASYPDGAIIGGAWNGINPRRTVTFARNFTTNSAGEYFFSVSPQFSYGILDMQISSLNPGFNGYFSIYRDSPRTLLNQVGIKVFHHDGTAATNTFCGAVLTVTGW